MNARIELDVASLSHPGMVRSHNEDSVFVDSTAGIAILADGMGGYNAGEVASGIAVNVVSSGMLPELASGRELSKVDVQSGLSHAALLLQQQIAAANKGIYDAKDMRTTGGADVNYAMDIPPEDSTLVARLRAFGAILYAQAHESEYNAGSGDPGGAASVERPYICQGGSRESWGRRSKSCSTRGSMLWAKRSR